MRRPRAGPCRRRPSAALTHQHAARVAQPAHLRVDRRVAGRGVHEPGAVEVGLDRPRASRHVHDAAVGDQRRRGPRTAAGATTRDARAVGGQRAGPPRARPAPPPDDQDAAAGEVEARAGWSRAPPSAVDGRPTDASRRSTAHVTGSGPQPRTGLLAAAGRGRRRCAGRRPACTSARRRSARRRGCRRCPRAIRWRR